LIPEQCLVGILYSSTKLSVSVTDRPSSKFGYQVRVSCSIRDDIELLEAIKRTLLQSEIESVIKKKESKSYDKPVLKITGIDNIHKLVSKICNQPPTTPCLPRWENFLLIIELIRDKKHYTEKGFDQILLLKELI
tara:strand:+ start:8325 stop:8729 length:405 start_codon:yes stop_codon:yes gene_type:complete